MLIKFNLMEFLELGLDRIHELISDCFSLVLESGLLYGLAAFSFGILVVFLCKKFKLFIRHNSSLQLVAKSYYVYIPLVMLIGGITVGGAAFGTVHRAPPNFGDTIALIADITRDTNRIDI